MFFLEPEDGRDDTLCPHWISTSAYISGAGRSAVQAAAAPPAPAPAPAPAAAQCLAGCPADVDF